MTADVYLGILDSYLFSSAQEAVPPSWIFQDDNDPNHRSSKAKEWLRVHEVRRLDWPSNAPDINLIENVWVVLKDRVATRNPKNLDQLEQYIRDEWARLA